jgi:hypothetical protein
VSGGDVAGKAQDVPDRQLGRRDDVGGRRVDDHDAGGRGGLDVDVVESDAGTRDDLEAGAAAIASASTFVAERIRMAWASARADRSAGRSVPST